MTTYALPTIICTTHNGRAPSFLSSTNDSCKPASFFGRNTEYNFINHLGPAPLFLTVNLGFYFWGLSSVCERKAYDYTSALKGSVNNRRWVIQPCTRLLTWVSRYLEHYAVSSVTFDGCWTHVARGRQPSKKLEAIRFLGIFSISFFLVAVSHFRGFYSYT